MVLCECGCGQDAGYFKKTRSYIGVKKGEPKRFITHHNLRNPDPIEQSRRAKCNDGSTLRGTGKSGWYIKENGQHQHIRIAEEKLGRKLLPGEIIHHKDRNKQNNHPDNIEIFANQSEHCKYHSLEYHKNRRQNGGSKI